MAEQLHLSPTNHLVHGISSEDKSLLDQMEAHLETLRDQLSLALHEVEIIQNEIDTTVEATREITDGNSYGA